MLKTKNFTIRGLLVLTALSAFIVANRLWISDCFRYGVPIDISDAKCVGAYDYNSIRVSISGKLLGTVDSQFVRDSPFPPGGFDPSYFQVQAAWEAISSPHEITLRVNDHYLETFSLPYKGD